jgi:tRNA1Val (adenine37-N6)-methyltransferase
LSIADLQTTDSFFDGRLQIKQATAGYRFSIDAVLLAHHIRPRKGERLLDLGTGCGIIPLILAYRHAGITISGIEIQDELADLAVSNVIANRMQNRIEVLRQDMRTLKPAMIGGPADVIVCNPPYRSSNSGRLNPDAQRAIARHELSVSLVEVLGTARRTLRTAGRFFIIYPAQRTVELLSQMRLAGIEPKFMRTVHSRLEQEAKRILVSGAKGVRPGITLGPPLVIFAQDGGYTQEVRQMFEP